jgi:squalene-hopene/tetraprenyl-beta-curcumene cyclase
MLEFPLDDCAPQAPLHEAPDQLDRSLLRALSTLLAQQHSSGYWCYELEADCTIPSEYILMCHFLGEINEQLETEIAAYLRSHQGHDGGWPLYHGGAADLSCSVKAYYALKLAGDRPREPHMMRARQAILAHGGTARCNVFTRITLALLGQVPWKDVPYVPVELILLPRWFPFHYSKVSYWSRTVMAPLSVLCTLKPAACNPRQIDIQELILPSPSRKRERLAARTRLNRFFAIAERAIRALGTLIPHWVRQRALRRAEHWIVERLNPHHGLGAIFPAMVNAYEALTVLGYPADDPQRMAARQALENLLVRRGKETYCQPCLSPVWDTALGALAASEVETPASKAAAIRALDWLQERQLSEEPGDWRDNRPELAGGGWPFQFRNAHYPDLDDSSAVVWAMCATSPGRYRETLHRAGEWIAGMQSANGGFAAFDVNNTHYYLNEIPFADHGALLDPPTSDVTARCVGVLAQLDKTHYASAIAAGIAFLRSEQEENGSWFGRWGTNYIYGTWSALTGLAMAGISGDEPWIKRAVHWLKRIQRPDGGWGEDNDTYAQPWKAGTGKQSTAFQTAWAILALLAMDEGRSESVRRGALYLQRTQRADGLWEDDAYTAPGFPRVFYLKYHGYSKYFPLWALAKYSRLIRPYQPTI